MPDAENMTTAQPPRRPSRFRKYRIVLYCIALLVFVAWRFQRHYGWYKQKPDVFTLYEKYKRTHPLATPPTEGQSAVAEMHRVLQDSRDEEKIGHIGIFFTQYRDSDDIHVVTALIELLGIRAALTPNSAFDRDAYQWLIRQGANPDLSVESQAALLRGATALANTVDDPRERILLLDEVIGLFAHSREPYVLVFIARAKNAKAAAVRDPEEKIRIYDEAIAMLEPLGYADHLAYTLYLKALATETVDGKLQLLDRIIDRYGDDRDRLVKRQVLRALEAKAKIVDSPIKAEVYKEIIARYGDERGHPLYGRAVAAAEEELRRLGE